MTTSELDEEHDFVWGNVELKDGLVSPLRPELMALHTDNSACIGCALGQDDQCTAHPCHSHVWVTKLEYVTAKVMGVDNWVIAIKEAKNAKARIHDAPE